MAAYSLFFKESVQKDLDGIPKKDLRKILSRIKSLARASWGSHPHTRDTWYQPLEEQADIDLAVHWVLGEPAVFLNTVADIHLLPRVLDAAQRFERKPPDTEMKVLAARASLQPLFT